jgi:hypothetical protein
MQYRALAYRPATPDDVEYVVLRMRREDAEEIFSARFSKDRFGLAAEIVQATEQFAPLWAVAHRDHPRPVALIGILLTSPGVGQANLIATPEWPKIATDVTRLIRDRLIPRCLEAGLTRVELRALSSWTANCRWIERLGAKLECLCQGFAPAPYAQYAWTK